MTRHRTDLVSLLSGLVFLGIAVASWTGLLSLESRLDLRWVPPALLIAAGLILLAGVTRRADPGGTDAPEAAGWESPPEDG